MSNSGINHIYINSVEHVGTFESVSIQETDSGVEGILQVTVGDTDTISVTFGHIVEIEDNDGYTLFYGRVANITPQYNYQTGQKTVQVRIVDHKTYYNTAISVHRPFTEVPLKDVLETLFTNYVPSDTIGSIPDTTDLITATFAGIGLTAAINQVLSQLTTEYHYSVTWNGSSLVHSVAEKYTNSLPVTINTELDASMIQPFTDNIDAVKNTISITALNMKMNDTYKQYYLFKDDVGITSNSERFQIAFDHKPRELQVFILYGQLGSNYHDIDNLSLLSIPVESLQPGDNVVAVDILKYMRNFTMPDYISSTTSTGTPYMPDTVEREAAKIIYGKYRNTMKVIYDNKPVENYPESEFGTVWVYTFSTLRNKLRELREIYGFDLDPNFIQGYRLDYAVTMNYTKEFSYADSISDYGVRLADPISREFPDMKTFQYYGDLWVRANSTVQRLGTVKFGMYYMASRKYAMSYPHVGDICDVQNPYGTELNAKINSVNIEAKDGFMDITISTQSIPQTGSGAYLYVSLLNKLEAKLYSLSQKETSEGATVMHKLTETVTLTMGTPIVTIIDDNDCKIESGKALRRRYKI